MSMGKRVGCLLLAAIIILGLTACSSESAAPSQDPPSSQVQTSPSEENTDSFDWKKFQGTEINIVGVEGVYNEQILEAIEPFEEKTGITIGKVDFIPEAEYTKKVQLLASSKSSEYDVYMVSFTNLFDYVPSQWIEPLDGYLNNPAITDPDLNMDDFYPSVLNYCYWNGVNGTPLGKDTEGAQLYAMPFGWIVFNLLYRSDLFEKYNIEVPRTVDDIIAAGELIQEKEPGMYGVAMRGFKSVDMLYGGIWQTILSCGGSDFDKDLNPVFDSEENIKGLEKIAEMINKVSNPSDWANMTWYEVLTDLQSGKCAMAIDAPSLATWIADGEDSVAKGKIDVAPPVYVDTADKAKSIIFGWNLGINAFSEKKDAAWYFLQYCTGAERQSSGSRLAFPTRRSAMEADSFKQSLQDSGMVNFIDSWNKTTEVADVLFTPATGFNDYGYILAGELQNAVLGTKSAKDALETVSKYYSDNYK